MSAAWIDDDPPPDDGPEFNPFDRNDQPEMWAAWEKKTAEDVAEARRIRAAQTLARATDEALLRMRARYAAENLYRAERTAGEPMPEVIGLDKLLAEDDEPVRFRIDRLWPRHGRVMLAAQFKAGKTTLVANLMRSLVDGMAFLGTFEVAPIVEGTVVLLDTELSRNTLRRWLRDQSFNNPARIVVVPMRGRAGTFDLLDDRRRTHWAGIIADAGGRVVALDCLGPVLAAHGLDENKPSEVGQFLSGFEAMLDEARVDEAVVVHHMGHIAERSRGASRLRDWPDAEWKLVREADEDTGEPAPDARRYFSALGRDVAESEALLTYDAVNRRLGLAGGNRRETKATKHVPTVLAYIAANPDQSLRAIERGLTDEVGRDTVRLAIRASIKDESVCTHHGPRNAVLHRIKAQCAECAAVRGAHWLSARARLVEARTQHTETKITDGAQNPRTQNGPEPERPLSSCSVCFGPLDDVEGVGRHPGCEPVGAEPEREWFS